MEIKFFLLDYKRKKKLQMQFYSRQSQLNNEQDKIHGTRHGNARSIIEINEDHPGFSQFSLGEEFIRGARWTTFPWQ